MILNGLGPSISYKTTCLLSNDSDQPVHFQPAQMHRLISHYFVLINQTSKLSLDKHQAHMQSCRKCCASAEILEILSASFIFMPLLRSMLSAYRMIGYCRKYRECHNGMLWMHKLICVFFVVFFSVWIFPKDIFKPQYKNSPPQWLSWMRIRLVIRRLRVRPLPGRGD